MNHEDHPILWDEQRTDGGLSPAQHIAAVFALMVPVGAVAWTTLCAAVWGKWECVL